MSNLLSIPKDSSSETSSSKQVTFNPNPVTIPPTISAPSTVDMSTGRGVANGSAAAGDALTSIKGTIPITDTADPTKVKNVLVSSVVPPPTMGGTGSDHTYAKTTPTDNEADDTSSSSESSSDSDTDDTDPEKPLEETKTQPKPSLMASSFITPVATPTTTPRKRGRPRKNLTTPQSVPSSTNSGKPTTSGAAPLRSILKAGSAPNTPVLKTDSEPDVKDKIRRRGRGCGSCVGCVREDCGKCLYCLDKPKYGGPGKKKQRCALRSCSQFVSVGKRVPSSYVNKMPDTPKTAAILTVAQHLVAAAAASGDNIPIAMPIQAPEPSPVQPETPIIKLSDDTFKSTPVGSAITINDSPSGKTRSKVSAAVGGAGGVASLSNSSPSTRPSTGKNKSLDPDTMKCVVCARERKLKIAKSNKFCTLRCMKAWIDHNPGMNPDNAEPSDHLNLLCMPPTTAITDAPRAIKKLLIDMALPGSQPVVSSSPTTSSVTAPANNMISNLTTNLFNALSAATVTSSDNITNGGGIKRPHPLDETTLSVKKYKEASLTLTSSTKTVPTTSVAKSTAVRTVPVTGKRRGPNDLPVDVSKWTVSDVTKFFEPKPDCLPIMPLLEDQEIDGQALLLLSQDTMVKCLGIKLGPALKIMAHVEQLKQQQATHT